MMEKESRFKIIFEKMDEIIKEQKDTKSIDFDELMEMNEEIRTFERIINDAITDDESIVLTRAS